MLIYIVFIPFFAYAYAKKRNENYINGNTTVYPGYTVVAC